MFARKRHSLLPEWVIPLCYAATAIPAGMILPRLEHRFLPEFNVFRQRRGSQSRRA